MYLQRMQFESLRNLTFRHSALVVGDDSGPVFFGHHFLENSKKITVQSVILHQNIAINTNKLIIKIERC
ncbi:hypothetical protein L596_004690 [Steinernema carpocapsae]|uniref:Uncharacterized protein n=1 Tax=Steinernema carpocapsae TaxID=34508 RepID=A0A4V6I884_STECR|nr:hypothetical protein L596_004690 [Steinernema carpocapsae]